MTFGDGLRLAGHLALLRKGKTHGSLGRVVRRLFRERAAGPAGCLVDG